MSIVKDYLDLTKKYQAEYGPQTIVLMEVGSFYEVYALIKPDGTYTGSPIEEFAKINEMVIARKTNVQVDKFPVVMAGMGTAHAEKYIQKLQEHDYTIVIYKQDPVNKTSRNLSEIISPGTYFPVDSIKLTNNIMCIWLYKTKSQPSQVSIGLANLDIYTGKTALFQFQTNYSHSPATYDEVERSISAYRPSECLLVANLPENLVDDIIGFVGLEETKLHKIDLNASWVKNAEKQIYQMELLKKFYPQLTGTFTEMLPTHSIAIQAFCLLLDFVDQHNPHLAKKLSEPVFENYTDRLLLANHSLSQLNIVDDARHTGKLRSVSALLNNCVTTMGQRRFMYHIHYPTTHLGSLQASYDITEHLLKAGENFLLMRTHLSAISDLEKFTRKMVVGKIQPKNFATLADDLTQLAQLYTQLQNDTILLDYLQLNTNVAVLCREIKADLERVFDIELCRSLSEIDDSVCIIQRGISPVVDHLVKTSQEGGDQLAAIAAYLSQFIQQSEKKAATYVKIHETAKSPAVLVSTSRRIALLKAALKTQAKTAKLTFTSNYSKSVETFELDLAALEYVNNGSSKTEQIITSPQIRQLTHTNEENNIKLVKEMQRVFQNYLGEFAKFEAGLAILIKYTTEMDLLQCKAYTAQKYNYCKPVLNATAPKAYFAFTGIRHPLIEHLQTKEIYVTNDLALGQSAQAPAAQAQASEAAASTGILLYGTNAVGKTSFIKSVGIALIMAQAGLYVPCNTFVFHPYKTIFTRILGNDNLFKGLSTFAVEMTELRTILSLADAHSLVLGDELCSGTESDSALSIFTAGLEILHEKASTFLFATHFHEINNYEEIRALTKLKMLHMAVHYNKENDILIYDRKLREGPGESMYGLEVCKSLNLPEAFLERAHAIRLKYHPTKQNVLSLTASHFNAKKLVGNCEICQQHKASEVHHLQHQKNASTKNEYIMNPAGQNFHKNHLANLLNICEACHKKIHQSQTEHKLVKTTNGGYILSKL